MIAALQDTLSKCAAFLPESFRSANAGLFRPDLLARLAARLLGFRANGVPAAPPEPHFAEEVTPPLGPGDAGASHLREWGEAFAAAGCDGVLLLLGQRRTPASLTDAAAIPPTREDLLAAADRPHAAGSVLSVAARAWAKHAPRSGAALWGTVAGGDRQKTASARRLVEAILDGATWWNVFGHYLYGVVFEARLPSGHGARWGRGGAPFIGFLEPFGAVL